jgi:tryptophan-rich sensory protein
MRVDRFIHKHGATPDWHWYDAALFSVAAQAIRLGLGALVRSIRGASVSPRAVMEQDATYTADLRQPFFAPPGVAFAPAWTFNNICSLWAAMRVLRLPPDTPGRQEYLSSQAASWLLFVSFDALYAGLRSPINGAGCTLAYFALTVRSIRVARSRLDDPKLALALVPLLIWLLLAGATAIAQALWNRDELYSVGPLLTPASRWIKHDR